MKKTLLITAVFGLLAYGQDAKKPAVTPPAKAFTLADLTPTENKDAMIFQQQGQIIVLTFQAAQDKYQAAQNKYQSDAKSFNEQLDQYIATTKAAHGNPAAMVFDKSKMIWTVAPPPAPPAKPAK